MKSSLNFYKFSCFLLICLLSISAQASCPKSLVEVKRILEAPNKELHVLGNGDFFTVEVVSTPNESGKVVLKAINDKGRKAIEEHKNDPELADEPDVIEEGLEIERDNYHLLNPNNDNPFYAKSFGIAKDSHGQKALALEYVEGENWHYYYLGPTPIYKPKNYTAKMRDFLGQLSQLGWAVKEIHEKGFIHNDIKPTNIMIDKNGHLRLIDLMSFTPKRTTYNAQGSLYDVKFYSKGFAAPEVIQTAEKQWTGNVLGPASDYFSIGKTIEKVLNYGFPEPSGDLKDLNKSERAIWENSLAVRQQILDRLVTPLTKDKPHERLQTPEEFQKIIAELMAMLPEDGP